MFGFLAIFLATFWHFSEQLSHFYYEHKRDRPIRRELALCVCISWSSYVLFCLCYSFNTVGDTWNKRMSFKIEGLSGVLGNKGYF